MESLVPLPPWFILVQGNKSFLLPLFAWPLEWCYWISLGLLHTCKGQLCLSEHCRQVIPPLRYYAEWTIAILKPRLDIQDVLQTRRSCVFFLFHPAGCKVFFLHFWGWINHCVQPLTQPPRKSFWTSGHVKTSIQVFCTVPGLRMAT